MPDQNLLDIKWLTVAEVALVMRISKMSVYRLVHSGELPSAKIGRQFRVPESAVQAYIQARLDEAARGLEAGGRNA